MSSKWRHRGQDWQDMRDGAMGRLEALENDTFYAWQRLDAVLDAMEFYGFEVLPTALVDALREAARYGVLNVARRDKIIAEFDAYRAPVLLGQTEETQP